MGLHSKRWTPSSSCGARVGPTAFIVVVSALFLAHCAPPPPVGEPLRSTYQAPARGPEDLRGKPLRPGYVGYRFTHFGGVGGFSVVVIEGTMDGAAVHVSTVVGNTDHHAGHDQWNELLGQLEHTGFWNMPEEDPVPSPGIKDPDRWVIEGIRGDTRHRVIRSLPRHETTERKLSAFVELGEQFTAIGKIHCKWEGCFPTTPQPDDAPVSPLSP